LRVLLVLHHLLNAHAGAAGNIRGLGSSLEQAGCEVEYLGFERAFPCWAQSSPPREGVVRQIAFPWAVVRFLLEHARRFDVIDCSTGDAWLWASAGRPRARPAQALITRSVGLEHVVDEAARRAARSGGPRLSRRYPLYHGGFRLWEVARSLRLADRCILLNQIDRDYAASRLGIPEERLVVIPAAVDDRFHQVPAVRDGPDGPVRLAFVGSWIPRKGTDTLVETLERLTAGEVSFTLSILGCGDGAAVRAALPAALGERVSIVPSYDNEELPSLLEGHHILLFPSRAEGWGLALVEAMACGLAPLATRVGGPLEIIRSGRDGVLVEVGDSDALASQIAGLAADRPRLARMRRAAQATARDYRWGEIAGRTLDVYEEALGAGDAKYSAGHPGQRG
jgi:glycosyltransferase involved in cell wall biosynthesis